MAEIVIPQTAPSGQTESPKISELLRLINLAQSSKFADIEVAHLVASYTDEECLLLDYHELKTDAIPQMERAQAKMKQAQTDHDLRQIERAQWSIEAAREHIDRVTKRIETLRAAWRMEEMAVR